MRRRVAYALMAIGLLFVVNAVFGRYIVLPGYLESLEVGRAGVGDAAQSVGAWKVVRYLLWAYSFKLGVYFAVLGAGLLTSMRLKRFWLLVAGGFAYVSFAYIPLPSAPSIVYGVSGGATTAILLLVLWRWARDRGGLSEAEQDAADLRIVAYFFFAMATYTLCPLMGVKTFALQPERMIEYGLQGEAASFSFHLLIELVLGWVFVLLSTRRREESADGGLRQT